MHKFSETLAERLREALEKGVKLTCVQHTTNEQPTPYFRRHISLWIIDKEIGDYNLADLVEELGVAKRLRYKDQFSITYVDTFIAKFFDAYEERYGAIIGDYRDSYYWIAA